MQSDGNEITDCVDVEAWADWAVGEAIPSLEEPPTEVIAVLVTGGIRFADADRLWAKLDEIHAGGRISKIINSWQGGADRIAREWCRENGVRQQPFIAACGNYEGGASGRNNRMLKEGKPNLVVACPGNKGTADMVNKADAAGVKVIFLEETDREAIENARL